MLKASDIMTQDVATIRGSATVAEAVKLMRLKSLRALIVDIRNQQDAYGILTQTDIVSKVVAYGKDLEKIRVYEIMTKPCIVVNPDLGVEYVARLFANTGIRIAPVISNTLIGIISQTDILFKGDFLENPKAPLMRRELGKAIEKAKSISSAKGITSQEAIDAWALTEELEAEVTYQEGTEPKEKTAFQLYCEENPEILQVRHQILSATA
ncbi:CBS domain-containing protein [Kamptonema animale CS-326]|jgi:CBS domain-containing protein|uniref:CBS domain-containing protein n=1 Tax=Kamptonema animale TaxID=92934 RepID=UPI0023305ADB|nr:CBS domain-containing protein [Kamptonema animale]MDB9512323.1 CBS domain-containing protein [Kamptonema animale CS-326]